MSTWNDGLSSMANVSTMKRKRTPHLAFRCFSPFLQLSVLRRKKLARAAHNRSKHAQRAKGLKAKMLNAKRYREKAEMKKTIKMHEEKTNKHNTADTLKEGALPAYLITREPVSRAKV